MSKNFIDIKDLSSEDLKLILDCALKIKKNPELYYDLLKNKKMILFLEKNSTRTRISFEFAIKELGGHCCIINANDSQVSRGECIEDTAKVFDRYCDIVVIRTFSHDRINLIKNNCKKAIVINALTDFSHPCQIMADIMTIIEQKGSISGKKIAWIGDFNNVLRSWIEASEKLDFELNICCPAHLKNNIQNSNNCKFIEDKFQAVENCDVVTTDTWVSMGESKEKINLFDGFIVDEKLMSFAKKDAIVLHCLPAYRNFEISESIIENEKYSKIIFDEAENRLHVQKAIILYCFEKILK